MTASAAFSLTGGMAFPGLAVQHVMVSIPGGIAVLGSHACKYDSPPRWVEVPSFCIAMAAVSESQYRQVMGRAGNQEAPADHPVTLVTWNDANEYVRKFNARSGSLTKLTLPTDMQWEYAARGPAVDIQKAMEAETGRFAPADVVEYTKNRFENFVVQPGEAIYTDPKDEAFQRLLRGGTRVFGWRVFSTPSGRLTTDEVWYQHARPAAADWGPKSPFGIHGMTGGVWEWTNDLASGKPSSDGRRSLRGGSWNNDYTGFLRVAYRSSAEPNSMNELYGFRVAAPAMS